MFDYTCGSYINLQTTSKATKRSIAAHLPQRGNNGVDKHNHKHHNRNYKQERKQ